MEGLPRLGIQRPSVGLEGFRYYSRLFLEREELEARGLCVDR